MALGRILLFSYGFGTQHPVVYVLSVAAFVLQSQSWVVAAESAKPKMFTVWSFAKNVCQSLTCSCCWLFV